MIAGDRDALEDVLLSIEQGRGGIVPAFDVRIGGRQSVFPKPGDALGLLRAEPRVLALLYLGRRDFEQLISS